MKIRGTFRIRNELVIKAREEMDMNQTNFGKICGVHVHVITDLERLNFKNVSANAARKVAAFLGVNVEEIVPPELAGKRLAGEISQVGNVKPSVLLNSGAVHHALGLPSGDEAFLNERRRVLLEVMDGLENERDKQILVMKFGLGSETEIDLPQIADRMGISRQRIRQIFKKIIRRLQIPQRARMLAPFLDP